MFFVDRRQERDLGRATATCHGARLAADRHAGPLIFVAREGVKAITEAARNHPVPIIDVDLTSQSLLL